MYSYPFFGGVPPFGGPPLNPGSLGGSHENPLDLTGKPSGEPGQSAGSDELRMHQFLDHRKLTESYGRSLPMMDSLMYGRMAYGHPGPQPLQSAGMMPPAMYASSVSGASHPLSLMPGFALTMQFTQSRETCLEIGPMSGMSSYDTSLPLHLRLGNAPRPGSMFAPSLGLSGNYGTSAPNLQAMPGHFAGLAYSDLLSEMSRRPVDEPKEAFPSPLAEPSTRFSDHLQRLGLGVSRDHQVMQSKCQGPCCVPSPVPSHTRHHSGPCSCCPPNAPLLSLSSVPMQLDRPGKETLFPSASATLAAAASGPSAVAEGKSPRPKECAPTLPSVPVLWTPAASLIEAHKPSTESCISSASAAGSAHSTNLALAETEKGSSGAQISQPAVSPHVSKPEKKNKKRDNDLCSLSGGQTTRAEKNMSLNRCAYKVKSEPKTGQAVISGSNGAANAPANYEKPAPVECEVITIEENDTSGWESAAKRPRLDSVEATVETCSEPAALGQCAASAADVALSPRACRDSGTDTSAPSLSIASAPPSSPSADAPLPASTVSTASACVSTETKGKRQHITKAECGSSPADIDASSSTGDKKHLGGSGDEMDKCSKKKKKKASGTGSGSSPKDNPKKLKDYKFLPSKLALPNADKSSSAITNNCGAVGATVSPASDKKIPRVTRTIEVQCDGPDWTPIILGPQLKNRLLKNIHKNKSNRAKDAKKSDKVRCKDKEHGEKSKKTKKSGDKSQSTSSARRRRFRSGLDMIRHPQRKKKKNATKGNQEGSAEKRAAGPSKGPNTEKDPASGASSHKTGADERNVLPVEVLKSSKRLMVNKALGETILHRAARQGYESVVFSCLKSSKRGDIDTRDNAGYTALAEASLHGHVDIVRALLEHGADPNVSAAGGVRPLHDAVESDHCEVARLLVAYGADPTISTYTGLTPLTMAHSPAMTQFMRGLLFDITGEDAVLEDDDGAPKAILPWKFTRNAQKGYDVLADVPLDSEGEAHDDDLSLIEASETPHLTSFQVCLPNISPRRKCNCVLLADVLKQTGLSRKEFNAKHSRNIDVVTLPKKEFEATATGKQFLTGTVIANVLKAVNSDLIDVVRLDDSLRELLAIECFRF